VAVVNIGTAIIGILQAFMIGRLFGTTSNIEIYFAAVAFYQSMVSMMQTGQIAELFTPIYHSLKVSHGQKTAFDLLSVLASWMILFGVVFSWILFVMAHWIVPWTVPGFSSERIATCITMFQWIIPVLSLKILLSLLSNLLAGEKQFVAQEVCKLACMVIALILIIAFAGRFDAWVMIAALWVSNIVNLLMFVVYLNRLGYRFTFKFSHKDFSVWSIFKNVPSIFGYVFVTQLYSIALTAGLSMLPQGTLAVFTYARRINARINGILIRPISMVFFNHFSSALSEGDAAISHLTKKALKLLLIFSTFACVVTLAGGYPGLKALWLSEKFPDSSVFHTYLVISVLCFVPLISGLGIIFRKINMAYQLVRPQYFALMLVQVVCAGLSYVLIPYFGLSGAVGVVVANSALMAIASGCLLRNKQSASFAIYEFSHAAKCLTLLVLATIPLLYLLFGTDVIASFDLPSGRWGDFLTSMALCSVAVVIAGIVALVLKIEEFQFGLQLASRFFKGRMSAAMNR
jgi:putative peptidoglycan lipid II flippase